MIIPLAVAMVVERTTGRNAFAVLGGVGESDGLLRDGKVRAQGAFEHPILAGTFGATLLPLMIGLIQMRDRALRWSGMVGSVGAAMIVWAAASSGAFLAVSVRAAAFCTWRLLSFAPVCARRTIADSVDFSSRNGPSCIGGFSMPSVHSLEGRWLASIIHYRCGSQILGRIGGSFGIRRQFDWGGYPPPPADPNNIDITNEYIAQAVNGVF